MNFNFYIKSAFIFLGLFLILRFLPAIPVSSTVTQKQTYFTVSGSGKVSVVPDTAIITVGVTTTKPNLKTAQAETNKIINSISDQVKKLGVEDKDIETSNYSANPDYDWQSSTRRITGYTTNAALTITLRKLDNVDQVIDISTTAGANNINGVQFTVDEDKRKKLQDEARAKAIADAKTKASFLSSSAGMTLGRVVDVQESSNDTPRPMYYAMDSLKIANAGGAPGTETQVQPGSTDITSNITLSYETR